MRKDRGVYGGAGPEYVSLPTHFPQLEEREEYNTGKEHLEIIGSIVTSEGNEERKFLSLLHEDERSNVEELDRNKVHRKPNQRMFKHLLEEKNYSSYLIRTQSSLDTSEAEKRKGVDISETDTDESDDSQVIIKPVYKNRNQIDLWENCYRHNNAKVDHGVEQNKHTDTLKEAIKHRPSVTEFIREIKRANKEDMERRRQRERARILDYDTMSSTEEVYDCILAAVQGVPVGRGAMVGCQRAKKTHRTR